MYILFVVKTLVTNPAIIEALAKKLLGALYSRHLLSWHPGAKTNQL